MCLKQMQLTACKAASGQRHDDVHSCCVIMAMSQRSTMQVSNRFWC